jgi:hypothetical protein
VQLVGGEKCGTLLFDVSHRLYILGVRENWKRRCKSDEWVASIRLWRCLLSGIPELEQHRQMGAEEKELCSVRLRIGRGMYWYKSTPKSRGRRWIDWALLPDRSTGWWWIILGFPSINTRFVSAQSNLLLWWVITEAVDQSSEGWVWPEIGMKSRCAEAKSRCAEAKSPELSFVLGLLQVTTPSSSSVWLADK